MWRGEGEIIITEDWKIVRQDKLNWVIWHRQKETLEKRGKTSKPGWKKIRGFYFNFTDAAFQVLQRMAFARLKKGVTIELREVISAIYSAEKKIMKAMMEVLTRRRKK